VPASPRWAGSSPAPSPPTGRDPRGRRPASHRSPRDAIRHGIALIEQDFALVPQLSVLDNVFLGVELGRHGLLDRAEQRRRLVELAERIAFRRDPSSRVGTLSVADQQKVEILRALVRSARLIVMDEPTAALSRVEAERLLQITRDLRAGGVTVIYVSHVLADVWPCATA